MQFDKSFEFGEHYHFKVYYEGNVTRGFRVKPDRYDATLKRLADDKKVQYYKSIHVSPGDFIMVIHRRDDRPAFDI